MGDSLSYLGPSSLAKNTGILKAGHFSARILIQADNMIEGFSIEYSVGTQCSLLNSGNKEKYLRCAEL